MTAMLKPAPFLRSRSSDSSASSLSSTFSDIIPSSISDSSSTSKTNAFFASPFSTRPPSPIQPEQKSAPPPTGTLTADFFATPLRIPSPPKITTTTTTVIRQRTIETRLPTPPPPASPPALPHLPFTTIQGPNFESSSSEPTPRPPDLEPTLLHFERSLLLARQESQKRNQQPQPEPELELISDDDGEVEEEPHTGSIISLNTVHHHHHPIPRFSLSPIGLTFPNPSLQDDRGTSTPTNEPSSKPSEPSKLHCIYPSNFFIFLKKTLFFNF